MKKRMVIFTCVTTIIGFMVAIQFQSLNETTTRDTRNMAELRQALTAEKERQQELNSEIEKQAETLYQLEQTEDVEDVMTEVIDELKEVAGLTEVQGPGIKIKVGVALDENYSGGGVRSIPPYLLRLLINELNIQGAEHIAIDNQRIVSTTAVREVNDRTLINGTWLSSFPIEIKVISNDSKSIHHAMMSSQSRELFSYENLSFDSTTVDQLTIPALDKKQKIQFMEPVHEES